MWSSTEEQKDERLVCSERIHTMNLGFLIGFGRQIASIPMNNHVCYANWPLCAGLSRIIVHNYNSYLLLANQLSHPLHPWEASPPAAAAPVSDGPVHPDWMSCDLSWQVPAQEDLRYFLVTY